MFEKRSKILLATNILGLFYGLYLITDIFNLIIPGNNEQLILNLATAVITYHIGFVILSALLGFLGFFKRNDKFTLASSIFYFLAATLLYSIPGFISMTPLIFLSFIGDRKQKQMAIIDHN